MNKKLEIACLNGQIQKVKNILENNTMNIHANNGTAIVNVCINGNITILNYLIQNEKKHGRKLKLDINDGIIFKTIYKNKQINILTYILKYCITYWYDIRYCLKCIFKLINETSNNIDNTNNTDNTDNIIIDCLIKFCIENKYSKQLFICAYQQCSIGIIKYLTEYYKRNNYKFDINIDGDILFVKVLKTLNHEKIIYLIEYCENVGKRIDLIHYNKFIFKQLCYSKNIIALKYIIAYSEKMNQRIDLYIHYIAITQPYNKIIFRYLWHLYKHNYNYRPIRISYCVSSNILCDKYIKKNLSFNCIYKNNTHKNISKDSIYILHTYTMNYFFTYFV